MSTSFTVQHSISSGNTAGSPISPSSARLDTMGEGSPLGRDPVAMARSTPISRGTERAPSSRISSTRSLCNPSSAIRSGYDGRRIAFGQGSGGHGTQHADQQRTRAGAVFQDFVHQISVQPVLGHLQQIVPEPIGLQPLADLFRLIPAFLKESIGHD